MEPALQPVHYRVLLYANVGLFCDGYILSSVGLALVTLMPRFHMSPVTTGLLGAATLLGILLGAPIFGNLTDRHGRRRLMIADLCVFVIAAVAQIFANNAWELIGLRFVLGLAIGADYPIAAALLAEFMPSKLRGAALNSMQVTWFVGATVAYIVGYRLLALGPESWKWILASPALFAAIGLVMRTGAPESPMWLASRESGELKRTSFTTMFRPEYRGALTFVSAMWLLQVVPLFAIYTFAPTVLSALGLNSQSSPAGSVVITIAFAAGSLVAMPLLEYWGRRPLCIAGFAIGIVAFTLLLLNVVSLVIVCFLAYALGIGAASGLELIYPCELFPTSIRGTATGFAAAVSRIGAFVGTFVLPIILARHGVTSVLAGAAALCACGLLIAFIWAPETKGTQIA